MTKKKWLVISYFANIDAMAPSHHIDDRLPLLREKGIDFILLSSPCGTRFRDLRHVRVPSPAPSGIRYEVRYFLRKRARKRFWFKFWETLLLLPVYPFYFLEKILLRLDSTWSWFITASAAAVITSVRERPEVIYSTGGPVSAHIAAMVASSLMRIPHVAEFQDPLVHQYAAPGRFERHIIRHLERLIMRTAAVPLFLTKKAAENAFERNQGKSPGFLYPGANPFREASHYRKGETFTIAHFGSLGGSRDLRHLFPAIVMLFRQYPDLAGEVRLDLYGNISRGVSRQIEQFPYRHILHVRGKVKRQEAVKAMQTADLLLLIQNTDDVSFETIPSKVYEYLHAGRPVLALIFRNPEFQEMLEEAGHNVVEADDDMAIRGALEEAVKQWKDGAGGPAFSESPYTVERAVERLIALADKVA
ncbi:MAG: hypothetical protein HZA17_15020 [Nitrospirae bacterium]|nr:hypothetical protein [Nitrospirota bacterium]